MEKIITSESVNIGHPDKTCDSIADAFLDAALSQDKDSQMAVECAIKDNNLFIYGEATTKANIPYAQIASEILKDIGYTESFKIVQAISEQSADIHQAVVKEEVCANDQGMVYGYATNETAEYMPMPILLAHKLMRQYERFRRANSNRYFADAKGQVSICYKEDKPVAIDTVLVSVSHAESLTQTEIQADILQNVILPVLADYKEQLDMKHTQYIVNPSGKFTIWEHMAIAVALVERLL